MEARLIFSTPKYFTPNNKISNPSPQRAIAPSPKERKGKGISPLSAIFTQEAALFYLEIEYAGGAHVAHIEVESLLTEVGWHLHERARA